MAHEHESNRQAWNEAAEYYWKQLEESLALLRAGKTSFCEAELRILSPLKGKLQRCIHLQCAGGTDSLSLLNIGADEVVGIDISDEMIRVAQTKSEKLKMNATWIPSDILNTPATLNATADLVYTGKGAINWIMDISAWARVVARLLKPGAYFYLFEGHPFTYFFEMDAAELKIDPVYRGYFSASPYASQGWPETYVGKIKESEKDQAMKYEKAWPVSQVITALLEAGLKLEKFEEYPTSYWTEFKNLPEDLRQYFPNTYSVLARKPL